MGDNITAVGPGAIAAGRGARVNVGLSEKVMADPKAMAVLMDSEKSDDEKIGIVARVTGVAWNQAKDIFEGIIAHVLTSGG